VRIQPRPPQPPRPLKPKPEPQPDKAVGPQLPYWRGDIIPGSPLRSGIARLTSIHGVIDTGTNLAGIGGGLYNYYTAYRYFQRGQTFEGCADMVGGTAAIAEGFLAFHGGSPSLPILGGINALTDAAKDTYWGWKFDNREKLTLGFTKASAGGMLIAGGLTTSPALTITGAILYSGAVIYDNRKEIAELPGKVCSYFKPKEP
jgi:hypothetical protein